MGGRSFPAHKAVLASSSKFFLGKFTSGPGGSADGDTTISIGGKPDIFEALLEFVYTGFLKMTDETKTDIIEMAGNMHFTDEICAKCIKSKSPPDYLTKKLVEAFTDFKAQNKFCDIVVDIGGKSCNAHKAVLAASSKYFLAMFTSGFKEKGESKISIEGSPEIFQVLLDFLYTGKLKVKVEILCALLEMACYMQFVDARQTLAKYIKSKYKSEETKPKAGKAKTTKVQIPTGEVCRIWEIANSNNLRKLADATEKYLCKNWNELKTMDVFLETASVDFFKYFLKQEDLATEEEEKEILEMLVNWLKHDWESRRSHAHTIMTHVKLGLVPAEILTKLLDTEILEIAECKQLYNDALKGQCSDRPKAELIHKMPGLFATRSTITAPIALYTEKQKDTDDSQFFFYNIKDHQWESLPRFDNLSYLASFITVEGSLYAAGGIQKTIHYWQNFDLDYDDDSDDDEELEVKRVDRECTDEFLVYDVAQSSWEYLPSMISPRHKFPLVYVDGCIYAIGGEDEREKSMASVERYNIGKKEWEAVASLPKGFTMASAIAYEGKILVNGEMPDPDEEHQQFQCILVYDTNKNEWKTGWKSPSDWGGIWFGSEDTAATPTLFVHEGTCYDVSYYPQDFDMEEYIDKPIPSINALKMGEGTTTIEYGKGLDDNNLNLNSVGAFQIKDEIFLNVRGFVYNPNIKLTAEQIDYEEVDLSDWENLPALLDNDCSMIVNFTFDKKKLGPYQVTYKA